MAEHIRHFRDPQVDACADAILQPEPDLIHHSLVRCGVTIMEKLGAELVSTSFEGQLWRFRSDDTVAGMEIREPDIVIPALLRHGSTGLFYTRTADDTPLWAANKYLTSVPADVDTGNPESDSQVVLGQALHGVTERPRRVGQIAASIAAPLRDPFARRRWRQSTGRTKDEISTHYDHKKDFYVGPHGILDERYVQYSSGLLPPGHEFEGLEELQRHKVESLARKLELESARSLLVVGSGYGGLDIAFAEMFPDLRITSLTVSDVQLKHDRQSAQEAGVADQIDFMGVDYRNFQPAEPFDRVVSVEMIEAVDWRDLDTYFDSLVRFVNPDTGVIVLQSINIKPEQYAQQRYSSGFATTAIFPGGSLVPTQVMGDMMAERGFSTYEETDLTYSYALTLREWRRRMQANISVLAARRRAEGFSQSTIDRSNRGQDLYLGLSEAGFRTGHIQDGQFTYRPV